MVPFIAAIAADHEAIVRPATETVPAKHLLELLYLLRDLDEKLIVLGNQFLHFVDGSLTLVVVQLLHSQRPAPGLSKGIAKRAVLLADNVEFVALVDDFLRLVERDDLGGGDKRLGLLGPGVCLVNHSGELLHRLGT